MTSEILQELENNIEKMELLMSNQKFGVGDAQKFLQRYINIFRKMEDLEKSRDNWKQKYLKLKEFQK